jgi:hypothetical protein
MLSPAFGSITELIKITFSPKRKRLRDPSREHPVDGSNRRHCEEPWGVEDAIYGDEAIQGPCAPEVLLDCFASLAMTGLTQLEFHLALDPPVFSSSVGRLRCPHKHFTNLHLIVDQIILDADARFI